MKKAFILAASILVLTGLVHGQVRTAVELSGLKGSVKSVRVERTRLVQVNGADREFPRVLVSIETFDRDGSKTQQAISDPERSDRWDYRWRYTYDSGKREIRRDYFNANGVRTSTGITNYHDNGYRVVVTQHNPNDSINHVRELFYDDKFNKVREVIRFPNHPTPEILSTYDHHRRVVEEVFKTDGRFDYRNVYTYDDHHNRIRFEVYKADGTFMQIQNRRHLYDADGNIVETSNFKPDESLTTKENFTYEFDDHGNWTKRKTVRQTFKDTGSTFETEITYREINYYDDRRVAKR